MLDKHTNDNGYTELNVPFYHSDHDPQLIASLILDWIESEWHKIPVVLNYKESIKQHHLILKNYGMCGMGHMGEWEG